MSLYDPRLHNHDIIFGDRLATAPDDAPFDGARGQVASTPPRLIAGISVANLTGEAAIDRIAAGLDVGATQRLAFLNAHCVNVSRGNAAYRAALSQFTVLPDGVGIDMAARHLYGAPFVENLNGTDFVPRLLATLPGGLKVALLGGAPGVAHRAAARLRSEHPKHRYIVVSDGFFEADARDAVLADLERADADIVLVAMGVPSQEMFIADHMGPQHGRLAIGVGALFDFLAGNVARAPHVVRDLRLEWVYRLGLEPARLWRRYVLGNPLFLLGILRDKARASRIDT